MSLRIILQEAKNQLTHEEEVRENSHESMRKVTSLSKQVILLSHQKRMKEAYETLGKTKNLVNEVQELANKHPSIIYGGMLSAALQEYSEANIFLTLIEENKFLTPDVIGVPNVDYILGLADVIGEYRRLVLDTLRDGQVEKAVGQLKTMDEIYTELMAIDEAYMLVPGLRRKCDIARKIIEITRGDITQEVSRKSLQDYLKSFERRQTKRYKKKES